MAYGWVEKTVTFSAEVLVAISILNVTAICSRWRTKASTAWALFRASFPLAWAYPVMTRCAPDASNEDRAASDRMAFLLRWLVPLEKFTLTAAGFES